MSDDLKSLAEYMKTAAVGEAKLDASFRDLALIGALQSPDKSITQLNLSYNKLSSLEGISQFRHLTHLNITYNNIEDFEEFRKVARKENLLYLSVKGNPVSRHPDSTALLIGLFPRLGELDGEAIGESTRIDSADALELAK